MKYPPIVGTVPHILYGGDYNPEQWLETKGLLLEDMRLAKLACINTLSIGIFSWAALEPEEGEFNFSWLDQVMDMLSGNNISAVLATPSGARPAWMSKKYSEVLRVNQNRVRILHGERHNHCYTPPVYRNKVKQINTLLADRYKSHQALSVWHVSNEYEGDCHCELCQQAFQKWLQTRYRNLDELNPTWWTAFWSHTFTDWSQIESPSGIGESSLHGLVLDWKRFVTEQTLDFMKAEMEPLKRITPNIPCTTNMMGFYDGLNYFRLAEGLDVAAWDNYPQWHSDENDWKLAVEVAMSHDMNRRLKDGKPFMMMESSPSATNWQPVGKMRRPGLLPLQSIQAVAHGSDTVQYFQFRKSRGGPEKFHGAVIDHEGTEHSRVFREVKETGNIVGELDQVVGTVSVADVAIIYDVENRWALDSIHGFKNNKKYMQTIKDHYTPFWSNGITVDIIDCTKDFSPYKLIIAPMLYMLHPEVPDKLRAFVQNGGTVVATYLTGYANEHDLCFLGGFPGPLKDLFGICSEDIDGLYDEEQRSIVWNGTQYYAHDFCEIIHCTGAQAIATYMDDFYKGYPAATVNHFGNGEAFYIAARLDEQFQHDFIICLMLKLGIVGAVNGSLPSGCTAQVRTDGVNDFVFIENFTPETISIDIGPGGISLLTEDSVYGHIILSPWGFEVFRRDRPGVGS